MESFEFKETSLSKDKFITIGIQHKRMKAEFKSYKDHVGFLVTQCPLLDTVVDFWCLVYDHESSTIVTLDCTSEDEPLLNRIPANKSAIRIGRFSIRRTKNTTVIGDTKETEVCLVNEDNERIIKVFEVQSWRQGLPTPSSGQVLLKLIEMVEHWKDTASDGPITVVCMDGAKCCGLFCALFNTIQKLRYEDNVDIYQTVKQLQVRRPEFFSSIVS
ncbi:hypothetical protein KUTeg_017233 [Tegillarca granosa]|uniref:Uncharacterized protein n=1 Tax=Tegillarca granosa TaxID=220873 RepID=A0ABQ9ENT2_TEGGR|nr:hypothetical protein KUTeg_017233 [Tegillarca granosa]